MEPRNILWKNFTNIDRLVMKVGSNEAPGCTFENEAVHSRRGDHDWWLSMVLVTFWTLNGQLENGAATYGRTRENERNTNTKTRNETRICRSAAIALGFNSLATLAYL